MFENLIKSHPLFLAAMREHSAAKRLIDALNSSTGVMGAQSLMDAIEHLSLQIESVEVAAFNAGVSLGKDK